MKLNERRMVCISGWSKPHFFKLILITNVSILCIVRKILDFIYLMYSFIFGGFENSKRFRQTGMYYSTTSVIYSMKINLINHRLKFVIVGTQSKGLVTDRIWVSL